MEDVKRDKCVKLWMNTCIKQDFFTSYSFIGSGEEDVVEVAKRDKWTHALKQEYLCIVKECAF